MARTPGPGMDALEALLVRDYTINSRRSLPRARAAFRRIRARLAGVRPERAYPASLAYAAGRLLEHAAPATIRYELALWARSLTLARRAGLTRIRAEIARPRVENARHGFVEQREMRRLLGELGEPVRDAALFAYVTGWRRQEILDLTWDRVEASTWTVRLEPGTTKNDQGRTYPAGAHPELRRMLERRWGERAGSYVFHRGGRKVVYFLRSWKSACRRAGLGHTLFHDLRRSAVRNMERAGVPRSVAMQLTGHKTESIYRRYAITNEEDLARGVRLVAAADRRGDGTATLERHDVRRAVRGDAARRE